VIVCAVLIHSTYNHVKTDQHVIRIFLSILTAIFPREPGLAGFFGAKDDGSDNWSYKACKAPVKNVTINKPTPSFLQAGCPPVAQSTVSKH